MREKGFAPVLILIVIIVLFGISYVLFNSLKGSNQNPKDIYIGVTDENSSFLINTSTGETKSFIPSGYTLQGYGSTYQEFPIYLILRKDNGLYTYNLSTQSVHKISNLVLKSTERVSVVDVSISEPDKFYFKIYNFKPNPDNAMYGEDVTGMRSYFYDATSNQINNADEVKLPEDSAAVYDSQFSRFFIWHSAEPIKSSLPLKTYDIKTGRETEVVSMNDVGATAGEGGFGGSIDYNDGYFMITDNPSNYSKMLLVRPTEKIERSELNLNADVINKLDFGDYSKRYITERNMLFIGGAKEAVIIKFDKNGNTTSTVKLSHPSSVYINYPYTDGNFIYYQGEGQNIAVLNLKTLKFEKSLPVPIKYFNTVTLFK